MKVAVIGSGYVGTTTAAILANSGHRVRVIDIDQSKVNTINSGMIPFFEAGLERLIKHAIDKKTLHASSSYEDLKTTDIVFSCVGTPDNPDGSSNLSYVYSAAKEAAKYMQTNAIYVQKSTVPVGTGRKIENIFSKSGNVFSYVSNPEFLREGTAIADSLWFDRVVTGGDNTRALNKVIDVYKSIWRKRQKIASISKITPRNDFEGLYIKTNSASAELIKVSANAFLALKISFANSIAKLTDKVGADIVDVMDGVGHDKRIGRAFLNAGRGYGGGCFPKDVSGLISSATDHGVDLQVMTAATEVNESMPGYIANKAQQALGSLNGKRVTVLGLSFKSGTSDARKSPGVKLANILSKNGCAVHAYDPKANGEAKGDLRKTIVIDDSFLKAVAESDAVFIMTDWPEFKNMDVSKLMKKMAGSLFVDAINSYDKKLIEKVGFRYLGVGR